MIALNNYEKLINECEKLGAKVYEFDFGTSKPAGRCEGNEIYINKSCTTSEKYCVLLEELGHFLTTYGDITNQNDLKNRKQELFARRWGYEKVTLERIIEAIEHNCCNRYEVAEYLNVTDKYFSECIQNYRKKYGVNVRIGKYTLIFEPSFAVLIDFRWKGSDVI